MNSDTKKCPFCGEKILKEIIMKKFLLILLFGIAVLLYTTAPVFAENYKYKLYDPKTNKSDSAVIITVGYNGKNSYTLGLAKQNGACIIDSIENKENGLVGGKCVGFTEANNGRTYFWKEYQPNTFNIELKSIVKEREKEGMYLYGSN